jgi:phosphinothricin acetyltransferase
MLVRLARGDDLDAIDDIYNHYVLSSTCTYQYEPTQPQERLVWFHGHDERHPVTVAVADGEVVGWGALSWFRERAGYRLTVESTVYVRAGLHRRGIGRALLGDLIARARALGHRTIVAGVSLEQEASIGLHVGFGFREVGRMSEVGYKFGQWLDVVFLQLLLEPRVAV